MSTEETDSQEFAVKCFNTMLAGYTSLCLAVGQKLDLFEHLTEEPRSSEQIAKSAGFKERYIREWLNSMVAAGFIDANEDGVLYSLKLHRKRILTKETPQMRYLAYLPMFAQVFEQLIDCFKLDGKSGIPYEMYPDFHVAMTIDSDVSHRENMMDKFIPAIPGLSEKLNNGIECLDVGCGHGTPSILLGKQFPKSSFYGIDFFPDAVEFAKNRAEKDGLNNAHFLAYDCCKLPAEWSNKFDHVTSFDSIHDQAYPDKALREIYRVLKPGGFYSMIDVRCHSNVKLNTEPYVPFLYTASLFHCMPVSLYYPGGMGLGTVWGVEKAQEMVQEAGFIDIDFSVAGTSTFNYHCLAKKPL